MDTVLDNSHGAAEGISHVTTPRSPSGNTLRLGCLLQSPLRWHNVRAVPPPSLPHVTNVAKGGSRATCGHGKVLQDPLHLTPGALLQLGTVSGWHRIN